MKYKMIIPLCLFLTFVLFHSTAFSGELPKDFRGLSWGTYISKVEGLVFKKEGKNGEQYYYRPSDKLKVGSGQVDAIRYKFLNKQLLGVVLDFEDYKQFLNIKSLFIDIYGPPDREEKKGGSIKYFWYTKKNDEANVNLIWMDFLGVVQGIAAMDWKGAVKKDTGL